MSAPSIKSGLPAEHIAGDLLQWRESEPESVASVQTAAYHFRKNGDPTAEPGENDSLTATGEAEAGNDGYWIYTLDGAATAGHPAGLYVADRVVEYTSGRSTDLGCATLRLRPDPVARREPTHAENMVAALEAFLEGDPDFIESHNLDGSIDVERLTKPDARRLLQEYRADVDRERRQRRAEAGHGTGRRILTHTQ